jgi:hypothetical protein
MLDLLVSTSPVNITRVPAASDEGMTQASGQHSTRESPECIFIDGMYGGLIAMQCYS